jgi:hypothetical protein
MTPQAPVFYPSDERKSYTLWLVYKLGGNVCGPVKMLVCVITRVSITVRRFKSGMLPNINGDYVRTPNDEGSGAEKSWSDGLKATFALIIQQGSIRSVIKFKLCVDRVCWICSRLVKWWRVGGVGPLSPVGLVCDSSVITLPQGTGSQPIGMPIVGFRHPFLVAAADHHTHTFMWSFSLIAEKWIFLLVLSLTDKHSIHKRFYLFL